jgi:anti-anti-sigma factor
VHAPTTFRVTTDPELHALSVAGDFDMGDVEIFRAAMADLDLTDGHTITINLEGLTYLGSAGLGELVRAAANGTKVQLANVPPHAQRVLELTKTAELFNAS